MIEGLPGGWRWAMLGDVADILDAQRVPVNRTDRQSRYGIVPYYGATGQVGWIDQSLFDDDLVLLGEDGAPFLDPTANKSYRISGPAWVNNHAHVLRARQSIDWRFLEYALNQLDYRPYVNGTTRLKLTQASLRALPIPLPPLDEQRRIVAILEDHLAHLDQADHELQSAMAQATTYAELVIGILVREAVECWPLHTVADHATLVQYGTSQKTKEKSDQSSVPVLRMGNIQEGVIDWNGLKYLPEDTEGLSGLLLQPGDLLFNRTNSAELVGKSALVDRPVRASFASYLIRVRFDGGVLPTWANTVINSSFGREYVTEVATQQVGQANVNGTKLKCFPLPLPPLDVQRRLVAQAQDAIGFRDQVRATTSRLRARSTLLRRSLLAAAFRGDLTADWRAARHRSAVSVIVGPSEDERQRRERTHNAG